MTHYFLSTGGEWEVEDEFEAEDGLVAARLGWRFEPLGEGWVMLDGAGARILALATGRGWEWLQAMSCREAEDELAAFAGLRSVSGRARERHDEALERQGEAAVLAEPTGPWMATLLLADGPLKHVEAIRRVTEAFARSLTTKEH